MNLWRWLESAVTVELMAAAPEGILTAASSKGITFRHIVHLDPLHVRLTVSRREFDSFHALVEKHGATVKLIEKTGAYCFFVRLFSRPVLLVGVLLLFALTVILPTRVLFVTVEGNQFVPTKLIMENLAQCGLDFGASRQAVRSEKTKNKLLSAMPQLQWVGINTEGCVAVVSVKERSAAADKSVDTGVQNIVATKDGIISEMTVLRGTPLCKVGQAVRKGQVLVSGYADYGLVVKATGADAEIFANTATGFFAFSLNEKATRTAIKRQEKRYSLLIGKKLINLYKGSGISSAECVRMYKESYMTLPGGLQLPVALVTEQLIYYDIVSVTQKQEQAFLWMQAAAEDYLRGQMLSGAIEKSDTVLSLEAGVCKLYGAYRCRELIGRIRHEETFDSHE